MDPRTKTELEKYGYRLTRLSFFGRDRWTWKFEYFVELGTDGSWTGWSTTGGETKKGKGFYSLAMYLHSYHT